MQWSLVLTTILISLVAADGAWKRYQEYKYKWRAKTLAALPKSNNQWIGAIFRGCLSILPQSETILIGKVSQSEYAEVQLSDGWYSHLEESEFPYKPWSLSKPFEIHLKNGTIDSLSVDGTMTYDQINHLKVIVSQFQVDTNVQDDTETVANNEFKKMERTVGGNCETIYEIIPLPKHLTQAGKYKREREFIDIIKTKNYSNCIEHVGLINALNISLMENGFATISLSEVSRITILGSLKNYTIQSVVTTTKVLGSPASENSQSSLTIYNVNVTLETIKENSGRTQILPKNLSNIGSLMYTGPTVTNKPRQDDESAKGWSEWIRRLFTWILSG